MQPRFAMLIAHSLVDRIHGLNDPVEHHFQDLQGLIYLGGLVAQGSGSRIPQVVPEAKMRPKPGR